MTDKSELPEDLNADPVTEPGDALVTGTGYWCVLRVASNREHQVREALLRKIQIEKLQDEIIRVLVPTEKVKRVRGSQQRVYERKLYPGYVFLEMLLDESGRIRERSWFMIKETQGVGDFIGTGDKPTPMSDADVTKMIHQVDATEESPSIKMEFNKGDQVKIKGGAFEGFEGTVEEIDAEKGTIRVIVTIFGRATPLDIEYWQIEKA
ncbi:MAG: transcription termination/antitermination protein NusG [Phycisphaerae bacterium]|nr:transcription termination/antitermination protein NusG [Phycisphaerae bacterium]